jgi:hypothetical protein
MLPPETAKEEAHGSRGNLAMGRGKQASVVSSWPLESRIQAVDEVALFLVVQKQKRPVGHLRQRAHRLLTCSFPSLVDLPPAGSSLILSARTTDSRDSDELTVYWNSRDTWNTIEHQH